MHIDYADYFSFIPFEFAISPSKSNIVEDAA